MSEPYTDEQAAPGAVRVVLRPIGSPVTLGLSGLGIASVVESGLALAWLPPSQTRDVGLILIAVPFVLQSLACVLLYLARDGVSAAAVGVLATSWLALGLVDAISGGGSRSGAVGLLLLGAAAAVAIGGGTSLGAGLLPGAVFVLAALRFAADGIYQLGAANDWLRAGGIIGLVVAAAVLYAGLAFELKAQTRRTILPTFQRRGPDRAVARLDPALDGLLHEPGVRRGS